MSVWLSKVANGGNLQQEIRSHSNHHRGASTFLRRVCFFGHEITEVRHLGNT